MILLLGYLGWANALPPLEPDHSVLPSPNGYDVILAAVQQLTVVSVPSSQAPWSADPQALRRELPRTRPILDQLRAGLRLPFETPPSQSNLNVLPPFAAYRSAARHLSAEAALALANDRPAEAMDRSLDAIELGACVGRGTYYFGTLTSTTLMAVGVRSAEQVLTHLSAAEAHSAGARLERIMARLPEPAQVQLHERRATLLWLREAVSGNTPFLPTSSLMPDTKLNEWLDRARLFVYPKSWAYHRLDDYQRAVAVELGKPYPQRKAPPPPGEPLNEITLAFADLSLGFARRDVRPRLLRCELALHEYRMRHGEYPRKLSALVPEIVAQIPEDPFSAQPLRYRRRGSSYVVYSVGPDLQDDGGRPIPTTGFDTSSKGDLVASPPRTGSTRR